MIHYATPPTMDVSTMPRKKIADPNLIGPEEAAQFLGVSRATFYRLVAAGLLAGVRTYMPTKGLTGRPTTYYFRADLERWKAERSGETPATEQG
jgi:predicted DNA-binding transcriptional regulator AlpA